VELSPYNADYHENLGMAYYSRNDLEGAINEMRKAATLDGRNSEYQKNLGLMFEQSGHLDQSVKAYKRALETNPRDGVAHALLGRIYFHQNLYNMAVLEFQKALEVGGDEAATYILLARSLSAMGRVPDAVLAYKKAIALQSSVSRGYGSNVMAGAFSELGGLELESGDMAAAKEYLHAAENITPDDTRVLHGLGLAYMAEDNTRKALDYFTKALVREPQNDMIFADLARLYEMRKALPLAIQSARKALELASQKPEHIALLAHLLVKDNNFEEAQVLLRNAVGKFPYHAHYFLWLEGNIYADEKNWQDAAASYADAVKEAPENWGYRRDYALMLEHLKQKQEAAYQYKTALKYAPPEEEEKLKAALKRVGK
ncbi:MAG: tetratricopeptide repeat protein, partial [Chloroflexi bacterium]|nr:tetratricopeptide repeat protein [Chloroflexota bacterium]